MIFWLYKIFSNFQTVRSIFLNKGLFEPSLKGGSNELLLGNFENFYVKIDFYYRKKSENPKNRPFFVPFSVQFPLRSKNFELHGNRLS